MKNKTNYIWRLLLLLLIPIGEVKAIFYTSNKKVNWYLLTDPDWKGRYIDNVLNDYGISLTHIILIGFILFGTKDLIIKKIIKFYFIIACLDLLHLGAYDKQGLLYTKLILAVIIWLIWVRKTWLKKFIKLINKLWNQIKNKLIYLRRYIWQQ